MLLAVLSMETQPRLPAPLPAPYSFAQMQATKEKTEKLIAERKAEALAQVAQRRAQAQEQAANTKAALSMPPTGSLAGSTDTPSGGFSVLSAIIVGIFLLMGTAWGLSKILSIRSN